jgi:chaperone BCS1
VLARKHLTVTLEVTSKDQSYPWVLNWLHAHSAAHKSTMRQHVSVETYARKLDNGAVKTSFDFVPAPGQHFVTYRGHLLYIERTREKQLVDLQSGTPWETLRLTTLGRDPEFFAGLLDEARLLGAHREDGKTVVYTSWGTEWRPFGRPRRKRPLGSVVLDRGTTDAILADVNTFLNSAEVSAGVCHVLLVLVLTWAWFFQWYNERGIPYRRGYLL